MTGGCRSAIALTGAGSGGELVALVRAGAVFIDGKLQERKEPKTTRRTSSKSGSVAA